MTDRTGPKLRFEALDGLRGVAAIAVAFMHISQLVDPVAPVQHVYPAALAVDFFFMLSGFVLYLSYGERLDRGMGFGRFMLARLIRLYPLVLIGVSLDAAIVVSKGDAGLVSVPFALLMLPSGLFTAPHPFVIDPPVWSLFFELLASMALATRARHLNGGYLALALAGCFAVDIFGWVIATRSVANATFMIVGLARTGFAFMIGCAIFKSRCWTSAPILPYPIISLLLFVVLLVPGMNSPVYFIILLMLMPLFLILGVRSTGDRIYVLFGVISFPLYILHFPVARAIVFVLKHYTLNPYILLFAGFAGALAVSFIALFVYDKPVRRSLEAYFGFGLVKAGPESVP